MRTHDDIREAEIKGRHIHYQLRHLWMNGEWFRPGAYRMAEVLACFDSEATAPLSILKVYAGKDAQQEIAYLKKEIQRLQKKINKQGEAE